MSVETRQRPTDGYRHQDRSFRRWRGQRPFWGGLLTLLSGIPIIYIPYHALSLGTLTIRMATTAGAGSLIIGVLLIVLGLTMWFQPQSRVFAGIAAILLVLVSLVVSNVGAFLVGFLLGLVGGALAVSWAPGDPDDSLAGERTGSEDGGADSSPDDFAGAPSDQEAAASGVAEALRSGRHRAG